MRVLVTGAASGIGAAIAASLSTAGHEVIGTDRAGGDDVLVADVGDPARWDELVDGAGPLDALVNCAGVRLRTPLTELSLDEWNDVLRINLTGSFLGIQAVARRWIAAGAPGAIVSIASTTSFGAVPGQVHYCVSKAGVAMLTKASALELAPHGIRVNAIAPGPIVTPMLQTRLDEPGARGVAHGPGAARTTRFARRRRCSSWLPAQHGGRVRHRGDPAGRRRLADSVAKRMNQHGAAWANH